MQKADDRTALPVCFGHHQDRRDSAHVLGKNFYEYHGLNKTALIEKYNAAFNRFAEAA